MPKVDASIQDIIIKMNRALDRIIILFNNQELPHNWPQDRRVVFTDLPGAGELITGPTVLGEVIAAGNLICASPPYLNTTEDLPLVRVKSRNLCVF